MESMKPTFLNARKGAGGARRYRFICLCTHSKRLSHVTGMFLPPGLSSTSLSSRDSAVKFSMTMSEKMARVTPETV